MNRQNHLLIFYLRLSFLLITYKKLIANCVLYSEVHANASEYIAPFRFQLRAAAGPYFGLLKLT